MTFNLTILGCSSAMPTSKRSLSAQLVNHDERLFLLDCGEGTQTQLRRNSIRFQRINHILISHLHGDHYFGLIGLLSTFHLLGRKNELHLYAIHELREIIEIQLKVSRSYLQYDIVYHVLEEGKIQQIFEDDKLTVTAVPVDHRIPTFGFVFKEKDRQRKIIKEKIDELGLGVEDMANIKQGKNFISKDGTVHENFDLTINPPPPKAFAYIPDTGYFEPVVEYAKNVDLMYHEATFMHDRVKDAREKYHSTTIDAATIAKMANVKRLIIGHYSARYDDLVPVIEECRSVFLNADLAEDGKVFDV